MLTLYTKLNILYLARLSDKEINNNYKKNESTAGADASVEVSKLHNIKLLAMIAIVLNIFINFATCRQIASFTRPQQGVRPGIEASRQRNSKNG